ncbi:hypothetical protein HJC99_06550 [Candidatus Saccharibacteria bacterium]|nr:hypothetical protein [Candidatus Saccharibacteria bacterium]
MPPSLIINLFGVSTAGKSTIATLLQSHIDRLYLVDFDVVKKQLTGYEWNRDSQIAQQITFDTLVSAVRAQLPILALLPLPEDEATYSHLAQLAMSHNYALMNIEMTAPDSVLIERYQHRLTQAKQLHPDWKYKTLSEFESKLKQPHFRPADTITFNSSQQSPQTIIGELLPRLRPYKLLRE